MAANVWKQLGSPDLSSSNITLSAWDNHPLQHLILYENFPISVASRKVMIDIKFIDAPLDYNLFLGQCYMYAISPTTSPIFHKMFFLHNGKIITINQLIYYDPHS